MKRIIYLANVRFPSERAHALQIAHMCQAFAEYDTEVNLIVNNRSGGDKKAVDSFYGIDSNFKISRLPYGYFNPKISITLYLSELIFTLSFLIKWLHRLPGIIISRNERILWLISLFTNHSRIVWESHEAKFNFFAKQLLKQGVHTVVISEGIENFYVSKGVLKEKLLVAHDGLDESFFGAVETKLQARERLGLSKERKIAMYIGGLDKWKGVETFFKAASYAKEVDFVVLGGTPIEIQRYQKIFPSVTFLGYRPYYDLKDNQQAADVLVIPNTAKNELSSKFTSPLKLFAHLASGIPIVASNIPSIVNVTGSKNLKLVIPDDPKALAEGVQSVAFNPEIYQEGANVLKEHVLKFTWSERAKQILNFIQNR